MIIAFLAIAVFLALAVHEAGHALGGRLRGMRLGMLVIGPVHIQREADGRLRWRLNRRLSLAGGVVSCVPQSTDGLRCAMLSCVAGGPAASTLLGVLVLAIYALEDLGSAEVPQGSLQDALAESTLVLGMVSFGLGLVTFLPVSEGAFVNDGKRIRALLRPGAAADGYAAVMGLGSCSIGGMPPHDWDPGLVAQALTLADGSYEDLQGRHLAYTYALHRRDIEVAGEHIRYLVDHAAGAHRDYRPVIDVTAAYFDAAYGGDAASARSRLAGAGKSPLFAFDPTARIRAEGAALLAEGDAEGAFEKLRTAYASLAKSPVWDDESTMEEIRRLCRDRGLPDPGADRAH